MGSPHDFSCAKAILVSGASERSVASTIGSPQLGNGYEEFDEEFAGTRLPFERRVADLPKQIEERERRQREMVRLRALATATDNVFGRPRDKRHSPVRPAGRAPSSQRRMTRPEERSARLQFLFLCAVLAVILMLLWKSLP